MSEAGPRRSGCAVVSGIFFIALGALLLAQNLTDFHLGDYTVEALALFADYWPLILIVWGTYKLFQRFATPERSRVSALEVLALVLVASAGIAAGATRTLVDRLAASEFRDELGAVLGPGVLGRTHRFEDEATFDLAPGAALVVENPLGGVRAVGSERADLRVLVDKRVVSLSDGEARELAEEVRFELRDGVARVIAPSHGIAHVQLELHVPSATPLHVRAEQGRIAVTGIAASVDIEASDEDVEVERLGSGLKVRTRYGDVRAARVAGAVTIESRRGSVVARELDSDLNVETARARLVVEDVAGNVTLANRSGSIHASGVRGRVQVRAHGTRVGIENAGGPVDVATTDDPIFVRSVEGSVRVDAENAALELRDVDGDVTVENRLQPVRATGIRGALTIRSPNGPVAAERVSGPITIEGTSEHVRVARFGSSLAVRTTHGDIEASTFELAGDVVLQTRYGDIGLALPASASFELTVETRDGELESASVDLRESRTDGVRRWRGTVGAGTTTVAATTDYGDVRIRASAMSR